MCQRTLSSSFSSSHPHHPRSQQPAMDPFPIDVPATGSLGAELQKCLFHLRGSTAGRPQPRHTQAEPAIDISSMRQLIHDC